MESQAPERELPLDGSFDDAVEIPQDARAVSGPLCSYAVINVFGFM